MRDYAGPLNAGRRMTPQVQAHMSELDVAIQALDAATDEKRDRALDHARAESSFKSWSAGMVKARIDAGDSAVKAQQALMASPEWAEKYMLVRELDIAAEHAKDKQRIAMARFDAERSKQATLRTL